MDEESLIILGVVSIVSAFIAMAIFDHKGRSASNGFALGFFLGWIGVIIAVFASPEQANLDQRKFDRGEIARCPYCKEFINLDAPTCKHCHQPLLPDAIIRQHHKARPDKCTNCQSSLQESAKFCPYCGTPRAKR